MSNKLTNAINELFEAQIKSKKAYLKADFAFNAVPKFDQTKDHHSENFTLYYDRLDEFYEAKKELEANERNVERCQNEVLAIWPPVSGFVLVDTGKRDNLGVASYLKAMRHDDEIVVTFENN